MTKEDRDNVRIMLFKNNLSQTWLLSRLAEDGIVIGKSELSYALSGIRAGGKCEKIVQASLKILTDYENNYANARRSSL